MGVAALFVLFPLWRHYRPAASGEEIRTETNLGIFGERQRELQNELAQGNLDADQYEALLLELKKSLLSDTVKAAGKKATSPSKQEQKSSAGKKGLSKKGPNKEWLNKAIPVAMVVLIPIVAFVMYERWGYLSDIQLMGLYEQTIDPNNDEQQTRDLVISLGRVVQEDESNQWAWYFLGRNFSNLGMFNEAEIAFQRSSDLMVDGPDKAATLGLLAQIKYLLAEGELNDEVLEVIELARSINPSENASLQLLSVDAEIKGDYQAAIGYWRLMIQANPNSALAQQLRQRITEAQRLIAQEGGTDLDQGPSIEVNVSLADGLVLPAGLRLFVAARNAQQEGMPPLAATDLRADDLPATVTLDNSMAITPMFNLASADTIYVTATVSLTGSANVQSGDYRVVSENFAHNNQHAVIDLVIRDTVP
jgi:cytochrome c-type biogenesis protein CcmH